MENPFRHGSIVTGEYFVDRELERTELELDMRSGQNVALVSPRRYGKTSLVLTVAQQLRTQGVLVAYLDLLTTPKQGPARRRPCHRPVWGTCGLRGSDAAQDHGVLPPEIAPAQVRHRLRRHARR